MSQHPNPRDGDESQPVEPEPASPSETEERPDLMGGDDPLTPDLLDPEQ